MIGLIENEIERDLAQRQAASEALIVSEKATDEYAETAAVSEFGGDFEQSEGGNIEEQAESEFEDVSGDENEEYEELDYGQDESEEQEISMGM